MPYWIDSREFSLCYHSFFSSPLDEADFSFLRNCEAIFGHLDGLDLRQDHHVLPMHFALEKLLFVDELDEDEGLGLSEWESH